MGVRWRTWGTLSPVGTVVAVVAVVLQSCDRPPTLGTDLVVNPATASSRPPAVQARPVLRFESTAYAFDTVAAGTPVKHVFAFTNEGPGVALVADVSTTCGCTVPKTWPRTPLAVGESGEVEVLLDTHDLLGDQDKVVRVVANTDPGVVELHVTGHVVGPGSRPAP